MTAEEILSILLYKLNLDTIANYISDNPEDVDYYLEPIRNFAKYHVQLVLKEALESIPCLGSSTDIATYEEVEEAVLNSYNLENIK